MLRKGCRLLGSGLFSYAYTHPLYEDCIIKYSEKKGADCGYLFALWCWKTKHPLFPKVLYVKENSSKSRYVVVMEKLSEEQPEGFNDRRAFCSDILIGNGVTVGKEYPEYRDILNKLRKDFEGAAVDMHEGNCMVRENGELVITDPYSRLPDKYIDMQKSLENLAL